MAAPLRVVLNEESDRTLAELRVAKTVPQHIKDRAHMVRLNAQGWNVPAIAEIFECQEQTVRATLQRWEEGGLGGLWDAVGRGAKSRWTADDWACVEQWLNEEQRTYTSMQLSQKLEQERGVKLSPDRIRRILKKKISVETHAPLAPPAPATGLSGV